MPAQPWDSCTTAFERLCCTVSCSRPLRVCLLIIFFNSSTSAKHCPFCYSTETRGTAVRVHGTSGFSFHAPSSMVYFVRRFGTGFNSTKSTAIGQITSNAKFSNALCVCSRVTSSITASSGGRLVGHASAGSVSGLPGMGRHHDARMAPETVLKVSRRMVGQSTSGGRSRLPRAACFSCDTRNAVPEMRNCSIVDWFVLMGHRAVCSNATMMSDK